MERFRRLLVGVNKRFRALMEDGLNGVETIDVFLVCSFWIA